MVYEYYTINFAMILARCVWKTKSKPKSYLTERNTGAPDRRGPYWRESSGHSTPPAWMHLSFFVRKSSTYKLNEWNCGYEFSNRFSLIKLAKTVRRKRFNNDSAKFHGHFYCFFLSFSFQANFFFIFFLGEQVRVNK